LLWLLPTPLPVAAGSPAVLTLLITAILGALGLHSTLAREWPARKWVVLLLRPGTPSSSVVSRQWHH
jgi:hypothetical protein